VIPTFEVITTVASSEAGADGDYSLESTLDHIRPWERPPVLDLASGGVRFALGGANPT